MSDSSPDEQPDPASGIGISLDTGLDWSSPDSLTPEEAQTLIRWYADSHGEGDLQLTPFVDLLLAEMPGTMKRYRRMALAVAEGHDDAIPQAGVVLLFLGHYMSIGNERGVLYEIIAARDAGVTRRQVLGVNRADVPRLRAVRWERGRGELGVLPAGLGSRC